jgi:hypothetical protein
MIVQIKKTYVVPKAEPRPETTLEKNYTVRGELDAAAEIRLNKTAALRPHVLEKRG